uniref:F-box and WD repeat domain containing 10 n=1 Tax=Cyprinus carpio TaxID=7962 RepID=A0A8C1XBF7_CYPCA
MKDSMNRSPTGVFLNFSICGRCQSCVLSEKLHHSTQWMKKAGGASQRRFLTGVLVRCHSLQILENLQSVLQVTSGKDFTYARSRGQLSRAEDSVGTMYGALDTKPKGMDTLDTWEWFRTSPDWIKSKYVLGLLSLCDTSLLHMLGNLVHILIVWEKHNFLKFSSPGKNAHNTLWVYSSYPFYYTVNDSKSLKSICDDVVELDVQNVDPWNRRTKGQDSDSDCSDDPDPALTVVPRSSKSLSGVSRHRDFIRSLPVDILQEQDLDSIYKGFKTKTVQLEERNVYCGVYNISVLLEREDPSRVMHYAGGQLVAVGSKDRIIRLLHVPSLEEIPPVIQGHAGSIRAVLVCEERDLVISASYDLSIRCWNLKTGVCMIIFHGHFGTVNCLDLYEDRLVSGAKDCRVKVWNLLTGKCVENLKFKHLKPIMCVKINETLVISSCAGGQIRIWSMETASLQISGHQGAVLCLCINQWHILSGGSDGVVKAWSTNSSFKKCLRIFQHPKEVLTMSFLFLRIITGCMDGKIRIFNFLTGDCLRVIKTNIKQCPVLSLHTHHNTVVVNNRSSVLMLQFAEVHWDYSASAVRNFFEQSHFSPENVLRSAERMPRGSSSRLKSRSHHFKSLSTPSMQRAQGTTFQIDYSQIYIQNIINDLCFQWFMNYNKQQ